MESFGSRGKLLKKAVLLTFVLLAVSCSSCRINISPSFVSGLEYSGTDVGGAIATNTTWTLSGSPYRVTADVLVLVGVFLNIEPGVAVAFENGTSMVVDGTLIAQGASTHKIIFTSNLPSPAQGDWGSIRTRTGGRIVRVEWATIEYSSGGIEFPAVSSGIVSDCVFRENGAGISGSNVNVTRCTFGRNANGVNAANAQVMDCEFFNNANGIVGSGAVQNTNVWNNSAGGISISGSVANCSIYSNGGYGVSADSVTNCSAYNNIGYGISANSVINCLAFNNSGDGISSSFSWGSVINCSIYGNEGNGIGLAISVTNCSISSNGLNGVSMANQIINSAIFDNKGVGTGLVLSGAFLSGCSVHNNSAGGVKIFPDFERPGPATASLEQTTIHDNLFGILISCVPGASGGQGRHVTISNCSITYNLQNGICTDESGGSDIVGLSLRALNTTVDSNGRFGISLNTTVGERAVYFAIDEVSGCMISNNEVGALGRFGSVKGCNIINNSEIGLDVFSLSGGINGNNIYDNGIYNIKNHFPFGQDLNATMNWWGTTNTTEIGAFIYDYYDDYNLSRVLFEPILTSPIPEFPLFFALPLFMLATLLTVISYRRKRINVTLS